MKVSAKNRLKERLRIYYYVTKPGIIRGNIITAVAGFLFAAQGNIPIATLLGMVVGTSLVIASGCVFNNYMDRNIDAKMTRTETRSIVTGDLTSRAAIIYAITLGVSGFAILFFLTNPLTMLVGFIGFVDYVILYGYTKRRGPMGTLVGTISGATPILAGYTAAVNYVDLGAILLFLFMVFWQMPHFYAIAIYRGNDYKKAGIPVLPLVKGTEITIHQMLAYTGLVLMTVASLFAVGFTGYAFILIVGLAVLYWTKIGLDGYSTDDTESWAKRMFGISLLVLLVFSIMISLNWVLP